MTLTRALTTLLTALCLALPLAARAMDNPVHLTILKGWRNDDGSHMAGLRLDLEDGWKTYWRAPGEAGIPPFFDLVGSTNLRDFQVIWPTPTVFQQDGLQSIGYKHSVILPILLWPQDATRDIDLRGAMDIGVCNEVCLPVTLSVRSALPTQASDRDSGILGAIAARPFSGSEAGVQKATCTLKTTPSVTILTTRVTMPPAGGSEVIVIEPDDPMIWIAETKTARDGATVTATSELVSMSGEAILLNRSGLRITVLGQNYAVDIQGCTGS